jgi:superfamily II DNA or RNA helicase
MINSKYNNTIHETFSTGVIYIYSIPGETHQGRLKIGGATVISNKPTQDEINLAATDRIKQQTKTADIPFKLEHAELSVTDKGVYFSDYDVHEVLLRSGYQRKSQYTKNSHSEWFEISLEVAKNAIQAVKEGRDALSTLERTGSKEYHFPFRPNQRDAIDKTIKAIKQNRKRFLWNAKMRFGKTSAAMQVAKELEMKKVLIVTHRPSVSIDWFDDFNKVFSGTNYEYATRTHGEHITTLLRGNKPFVYFASLQDLRLSTRVVSDEAANTQARGFDKNDEVFDTNWDMLIIDEAHEGTQSILGDVTFSKIPVAFTLQLSGTPFNILHKHEETDIYTWDYVMEQEEKLYWDQRHPGVPNPYAELPALSMFTYDIDKYASHIGSLGAEFTDSLDGAFKFHEFFRVQKDEQGNDVAEFVHETMVNKFLDLLVDETLQTRFPYSSEVYRNYNKHSLWLLPNRVKIIEAMEKLLKKHGVFGSNQFGIVNISGNNQDDEEDKDAKERVVKAIRNHDYTITLTGQRLTTGASIPEWTAVFMMSDTGSATTYLQTAFRCQTPAKIDGKLKTQGYVFDFAPDRTLRLIAEAIELNHKSSKINTPDQKEAMKQFLNFCPILAAEGSSMKPYDVGRMLIQLKKAIIERVSRNGFDDPRLYNDELLQLDELDIKKFNDLKEIVGSATGERINEITVNDLGMDELETAKAEEAERKKKQKKELSDAEKEALKKLKEARDQKNKAISILRAVSIRMPMMVYGADVSLKESITLQKFIDLVDKESWLEFMPEGLTKEIFKDFTKYYDEEVFQGVTRSIRAKAFDCDNLLPTERIQAIAEIFKTFKNPDKETVLTPWNVVNMQLTMTLGGHDFRVMNSKSGRPEWVSYNVDTSLWSQDDTRILEINSKSGLYPLLASYNVYSRQLIKLKKPEEKVSQHVWKQVLANNIYVVCKSPMAVTITRRTLAGYSGAKTNIIYIKDLVKKLQRKENYKEYSLADELKVQFNWTEKNMKFTAVVGNPPYQQTNSKRNRDDAIYHLFMEQSYNLSTKVSLITPARFLFNVGSTPEEWNKKMLSDEHLRVVLFEKNSAKLFPNTDIKGGIVITFRDESSKLSPIGVFTSHPELNSILSKVEQQKNLMKFGDLMYVQTKFNLRNLYEDYPIFRNKLGSNGRERRLTSIIFELLPELFMNEKISSEFVGIYGRINGKRFYKYLHTKYIEMSGNFSKFKIFVPAANGSGEFGEVLSSPVIGHPMTGHTQTFISIGAFDSQFEAKAMLKYLKSRFLRTMLGVLKTTHNNKTKDVWSKIPIQDFSEQSDIDWSRSVSEIDKQLYAKYGLTEDEIIFIETHVKPMG